MLIVPEHMLGDQEVFVRFGEYQPNTITPVKREFSEKN